ncbi:Dimer_Tnp_hAT domain-containing protein [Senna tora]|uniref:Dimer_Tnp_hAT domain-containing protein n=1 Tax=Senna tora TaxID=362788 RepID=A0A835CJS8_9FABA|nr:Dimer_Tnp_hAT domain-containing protein [Senna tora]
MLKRLKLIRRCLQVWLFMIYKWTQYKDDDVQKATVVKETILNDRHEGKELNEESSFYNVVYNILIDPWTKSCTPLHCLAHSLNPRYYCLEWLQGAPNRVPPHKDEEICIERNKCLRRYFTDSKERLMATMEFVRFSGAEDVFGQFECLQNRWDLEPKEWWIMYGSSAPLLQNLALKLLFQPCSSSCCERNWSTYSFIHSMKRNKINPKRAEDLVFVHTNLRHLSRQSSKYNEGETRMWDIGGDRAEPFDGAGTLKVSSLSLDERELEAVIFIDDGQGNNEISTVRV